MNEPTTKQEFDADPRYNGQPEPKCPECHRHASPRGRAAPMGMHGCECTPGPKRGSLWPNETREQFGYPAELVAEAKRLREIFYPPTLSAEQLDELQEDIRRADEGSMPNFDDEAVSTAVAELLRLRKSTEPRPMSEAPRVWSGPETHITMDVWKFGWTPAGYRWMGAHHRLSTGMIFVPMQYPKPNRDPSELSALGTCNRVDWLPASSGGEDSNNES